MNICFGESVRRLRREKGLTQEQLAARLNVSFQTISKWERDESYPDITMLPVLAGFFGVRTDDLLGIDKAENEKHIQELLDYFHTNACLRIGQWEEHMDALKQALKDNPNDYRLWAEHFSHMTSLGKEDTAERCRARLPEVMPVYESILDNCTNDAIRIGVKAGMLHFYHRIIWKDPEGSAAERALFDRIMGELPDLRDSRQFMSTFVSPKPEEGHREDCQNAILDTLNMLRGMITHLGNTFSQERDGADWTRVNLPLWQAELDIYGTMFPDGDYGRAYSWVMVAWQYIAHGHAWAGEYDEAFVALEKVFETARGYDALPRASAHTSPMFRGHVFDKEAERLDYDLPFMDYVRKFLLEEKYSYTAIYPWPEEFKADPRFGEMLSRVS